MKKFLTVCLFISLALSARAQYLYGTIINKKGEPLAYVSVFDKKQKTGTTSNDNGSFKLTLSSGKHTIVIKSLGFSTQEHEIKIKGHSPTKLNIVLEDASNTLNEVDVVADKRDLAKEIMKKVRDKRKFYLNKIESYTYDSYTKISVEREKKVVDSTLSDSIYKDIKKPKDWNKKTIIENIQLTEKSSKISYRAQNDYRENITAIKDYSKYYDEDIYYGGGSEVTFGLEYGEEDFAPDAEEYENENILYSGILSSNLNFYKNLIDFPKASINPLLSPIASTSAASYVYDYVGSTYRENQKIHQIHVKPLFKQEALFEGEICIEDSTWALVELDLTINKGALSFSKAFSIKQLYTKYEDNIYLPEKIELEYTLINYQNAKGYVLVENSNFSVNRPLLNDFKPSEIQKYATDAFDKDSVYWDSIRKTPFNEIESKFVHKTDSLRKHYQSEEYKNESDSLYNRIRWWLPLEGFHRRNSYKGWDWGIGGIFEQMNFFGVGGYRHMLPGFYNKRFKNNMYLETDGRIDYGFRNEDVKGRVGVGLTYFPLRSIRTYLSVSDDYRMVNPNASFSQAFSRSNWTRRKSVIAKQRMEIFNGMYAELSFDYSNQIPIDNLKFSPIGDSAFGEFNKPISFQPYTKTEIRLDLQYRPFQKYVIKKNRKIIKENNWPTFKFQYRKGIPVLFKSEVNFDYIELSAFDEMKLARMGSYRWSVSAGSYINQRSLRVLEYKFIRGSDPGYFSDPLFTFQLLDIESLSTPNEYFKGSFIHHFDGAILNKVPLLSRLKLQLAGGAGTLLIPDKDLAHVEFYAGLERPVKMWGDLVRFSIYGVTASNPFTTNTFDYTIKFGFSFYSPWSKKWDW